MTAAIEPVEVRLVELLFRDPTLTLAEARKEIDLMSGRDGRPEDCPGEDREAWAFVTTSG
jgi:hypothetical protein